VEFADTRTRLRPHLAALVPGLIVVALTLVWAVHDGGYDAETWYWGALASLGLLAAVVIGLGDRIVITRGRLVVLALFALYVGWCYLSMAWAEYPGNALDGANQALLYLLFSMIMLLLPWTAPAALATMVTYAVGVGVIGSVVLFRLASTDHLSALVVAGRLAAPTGYFNSTAALFTIGALTATALAARRELPGLLRGLLLAFACSSLQLAIIVQSRGWLLTLPLVVVAALFVVQDRFRVIAAGIIPVAGALVPLRRLLDVYQPVSTAGLEQHAKHAGHAGLLICAAVFVLGTVLSWADSSWKPPTLSRAWRLGLGAALAVVAVAAVAGAGTDATHGHPFRFISRQWNGFSHVQQSFSTRSHFGDVGSGRYDFWRVALEATAAHPVGGLGENNFADYYVKHRRTSEEPSWTHSLELRLLAQTGIVGLLLFGGFLVGALLLAARARQRGPPLTRGVAGVALLPLVVWLIHGSIDWFWELPALSGPALGFLGMAGGLEATVGHPGFGRDEARARRRVPRWLAAGAGLAALAAGVIVLGLPYLSVREVSLASDSRQPAAALRDLERGAKLNPFSATPGRLAGAIALRTGQYTVAEQRFRQAINRQPGGWFAWLGLGLAASALGRRQQAHRAFAAAYAINNQQPAIKQALARVYTRHPLTTAQAFRLFVLHQ
jgi:O-antigen ligase